MNDELETPSAPHAPADEKSALARWLGRREAFGIIAGRCSAADIECLCQIRDQKLYTNHARYWDEFCARELHSSRRKVDEDIRRLKEFGPAFFQLAQLTRVTPEQYRAIAPHIEDDGIHIDGKVIALLQANGEDVSQAVRELRRRILPRRGPGVRRAENILKHCASAIAELRGCASELEQDQKIDIASAIQQLCAAAVARGVQVLRRGHKD